jgi:hypothetical protein
MIVVCGVKDHKTILTNDPFKKLVEFMKQNLHLYDQDAMDLPLF